MKNYTIFVLISLFPFLLFGQERKDERPNIIIIMTDDMGYSDLGAYGGEIQTPNLDALAKGGIKMRNFYNNARCCPTRASLLTGQYPHRVGMGLMVTLANSDYETGAYQGFLDPNYPTIAEELKKVGYGTYMAGKWHVGERKEHWPLKRGFDRYFGLISGASSYYEITPQEKFKRFYILDSTDYQFPDNYYATDAFTNYGISFINQHHKNRSRDPFFLYLAYTAPHYPLHALEEDIKKYEELYMKGWDKIRKARYEKQKEIGFADERYQLSERNEKVENWQGDDEDNQWVRKMAVYAAMTDRVDQNIGKLIQALKVNDDYENTIIFFISDNGASNENVNLALLNDPTKKLGEKGSYQSLGIQWANVSNTPFQKFKKFMHEGGLNTPCIIHWPAEISPNQGFHEGIGHVIDLMPTALELAGARNLGVDGQSLSYLWKNQEIERTYCWEHEGNKAIRKGKWKLLKEREDDNWSLFDISKDPVELNNLAGSNPKVVNQLLDIYLNWEKEVGVKVYKK